MRPDLSLGVQARPEYAIGVGMPERRRPAMRSACLFSSVFAIIVLLLSAGTWTGAARANPPSGCDLVVEQISPSTAEPGTVIQLTVRIRNQGTLPAPGSVAGVHLDDNTVWWTLGTPALAPGEAADVILSIGPLSVGLHPVQARADFLELVDEVNESNNARTEWIEVQTLAGVPNASGWAGGRAPGMLIPTNPSPSGRPLEIHFYLPSEGPVRVELFDGGGRRLDELVNSRLPAGEHRTLWTGSGGFGLPRGLYFVCLTSSSGGVVRKVVIL
jgi:hypothetical protein